MQTAELEASLNHFSPTVRGQALASLLAAGGSFPAPQEIFNLHSHTFFSFNAYGYSPSALAWLARQRGFLAIGIVDFDVLDGVEEFLTACDLVGVRGTASMETRVYVPEFSTREINSPGEPGVFYYMGVGFTRRDPPPEAAPILTDMRRRAENRNRAMLQRLNDYLQTPANAFAAVDYARDVLPLTPAGSATERHILVAYDRAGQKFADPAQFWAEKLSLPREQIQAQLGDAAKFHNTLRGKLMKRGGAGYAQPGPDTFPLLDDVNRLIIACGALPCATWLDGLSAAEQAEEELLTLLIAKGAAAINIIPDRNWNIADPVQRQVKVEKLYEVVALAQKLDLPIVVGTEMNAPGQKLVDDFDAPALAPVRQAFVDGAYFLYGHTVLQRALGLGYQSDWAKAHLPSRAARNAFYTRAGRLIPPGEAGLSRVMHTDPQADPETLLQKFS